METKGLITVFETGHHWSLSWARWIQLTPWSRVLLEKLILTQLVKKFPSNYGTWRFITVFTTACHWSLFWARWIQLTNSMEQRPSSEANSHSASQEIPRLLWNPNVHHRVHKSPPLAPILSQMNSVHNFPAYFHKIHSNVIFSSSMRNCCLKYVFPW
jgi:hypothetical protein